MIRAEGIVNVQSQGSFGPVEHVWLTRGARPGLRGQLQHLQPHLLCGWQNLVLRGRSPAAMRKEGAGQVEEQALPDLHAGLLQV